MDPTFFSAADIPVLQCVYFENNSILLSSLLKINSVSSAVSVRQLSHTNMALCNHVVT